MYVELAAFKAFVLFVTASESEFDRAVAHVASSSTEFGVQ
ncbi:hypothetical protein SBA4_3180008 [Candidatus Sulfopaludibacter sp. SbA4]|nr:hypothetical protein SBA4_3180008 [Candidatus Sulfopaludibacter sp. SbA4]